MTDAPAVYTILDLAARWRCSRKAIYEAISAGTLNAFRVGKRTYRVAVDEVRRFEMTVVHRP